MPSLLRLALGECDRRAIRGSRYMSCTALVLLSVRLAVGNYMPSAHTRQEPLDGRLTWCMVLGGGRAATVILLAATGQDGRSGSVLG